MCLGSVEQIVCGFEADYVLLALELVLRVNNDITDFLKQYCIT